MNQSSGFYSLGIAPNILKVLDKLSFTAPTPIQEKSIPIALGGKDMIGIAQTGTGKTLAFGIPMLQAALHSKNGLVVLPTRELALQVHEAIDKIGHPLRMRSAVLIGGEPIWKQVRALRANPQIIIGTPGRIIDHLEQKNITLASVRMLVLDEADRMLDMGFAPQLKRILQAVPEDRQTMLFSATMPRDIIAIAEKHMKLPTRIEIAPPGTMASRVTHELFFVQASDKPRLLEKILGEYRGSILVFTRTKHGAKRVASHIRAFDQSAIEIHSNRSLSQRREALEGFRNGKYRILVATDIAARGIDVKGIELVINFDLPQAEEDYVHRIGRTGRAGSVGHAISFASTMQRREVKNIERVIRATLPLSKLPNLPPARTFDRVPEDKPQQFRSRPGGGSSRPGGGGFRGGRGGGGNRGGSRPGGYQGSRRRLGGGFNRRDGGR